ncbi:hypothetical protein [Microbacterium sp. NPDC076895]|uniref:hypothetical protein n=1 Tax=Microbacterium sp. NPDC076895 TaxID=3154957 RepID=UPI00341EBF52
MSEPLGPRDAALRELLVSTADHAAPRLSPRRSIVVAAVVSALLGAVIGGGASVAAIAATSSQSVRTVPDADAFRDIVHDDATVFGSPILINAAGTTRIELGERPEGATQLALALQCENPVRFDIRVDGVSQGFYDCVSGTGGSTYPTVGAGSHTVTIETSNSNPYTLFSAWFTPTVSPVSTEQSQALADGVVTEDEYREGFARFEACLAEAGFALYAVDDTAPIIDYSVPGEAVWSGDDERCYSSEFVGLDIEWQISHE